MISRNMEILLSQGSLTVRLDITSDGYIKKKQHVFSFPNEGIGSSPGFGYRLASVSSLRFSLPRHTHTHHEGSEAHKNST